MRFRTTAGLAWGLWALSAALAALVLALSLANDPDQWPETATSLSFLAFASVGAVVAARRPANPIGWLFCVVALADFLWSCALEYAVFATVTRPGSLPGVMAAAWLATGWPATLGWALMTLFVPLLFPTGRLLSPRWRPVAWLAAGLLGLSLAVQAVTPGPVDPRLPTVRNPLGLEAAAEVHAVLAGVLQVGLVPLLVAAVLSLLLRFRRARGEERQQLKWFAYAVAVLVGLILLSMLNTFLQHPLVELARPLLFALAIPGVPLAAGLAILRYRLYDIDLLINRTLVYGALTGTLLAVYFAGVLLLQGLFRTLIGQESNLAIVIATLVSAALFQPLRLRLQEAIDRRFYRRKYDAARVLAAFSARLRDEVELGTLTAELVRVADETMQPAHVSLWLRAPAGRRSSTDAPDTS